MKILDRWNKSIKLKNDAKKLKMEYNSMPESSLTDFTEKINLIDRYYVVFSDYYDLKYWFMPDLPMLLSLKKEINSSGIKEYYKE